MVKKVLEIRKLTKYYGDIKGVENLSIILNEGEIFGFIGPNGAGKSTTIRSIMNLINKTSGEVLVNNQVFNKNDIELKKLIGYLPSEISLYDNFTVKEMLDYHESFYSFDTHTKRCELVKILELDEKKYVEDLSLGNLKKLGIVLALMHSPKLIILDEPTSGLDPIMQNKLFDLLKEEKNNGATIFYSTHILSEISKICDRVGIIKDGNLFKIEDVENLSNRNLVFVTIKSNDISEIIKELDVSAELKDKNVIKFANNISPNELIKILSKYNIDNLLIEEATLEDIFLHYYK